MVPLFNAVKRGSQVLKVMREGIEISGFPQEVSMACAYLENIHRRAVEVLWGWLLYRQF